MAANFGFRKGQRIQIGLRCDASTRSARVAYRHRVILLISTAEQHATFTLVCRAGNAHIRDATQVADVISAGMRCAIGTDQTSAIQREHHWQVLQRHIMNQLVITAL